MHVMSKRILRKFWKRYPDTKKALLSWYHEVEKEDWDTPAKLKQRYVSARIVKGNRVIFKIKGNRYRLVARVNYEQRAVYIRFVGTHAEYDSVNVMEV